MSRLACWSVVALAAYVAGRRQGRIDGLIEGAGRAVLRGGR